MKIRKTKKGFILKDGDLSISFSSYEYSPILKDVSLYQDSVLVAIYGNREKFEEQIKRSAKGATTNLNPLAYPHLKNV